MSLPVLIQRISALDSDYNLAHHLVVEVSTYTVAVIVHRPVGSEAQVAYRLYRVDVGLQEEKPSSVFLLLALDCLFDPLGRIAAAGALHAVCGDDKERMLQHILVSGILVDVGNMMDSPHRSIQ